MAYGHFLAQKTIRGFKLGEVMSALQKAIRRGDEKQAVCWAVEMDQSGFGTHLWSRLTVIVSEDVGLAWPEGPATIRALHENWKDFQPKKGRKHSDRLWTLHAVMLLTRAPKSRRVDNAIWATYAVEEPIVDEIPDYALDAHTARGKGMGARVGDQGSYHVENEADLGHNYWNERKLEVRETFGRQMSNDWFNTQWKQNSKRTTPTETRADAPNQTLFKAPGSDEDIYGS